MTEKLRLRELLEEALDSDSDLAAEKLRAEDPGLAGELRRRLEQCRAVRDELEVLFPSETVALERDQGSLDESLPAIAGYEVVSVLGHGGMGVVYKARHLALNRLVAIKMLIAGAHSGPGEQARIKREAEALARLTHPNIVQVYDVGELEGKPYFTMEIMEGGSLGEKLAGAPQPAEYAASTMISLAIAVEAAHKRGIVHRDLKPANVLLAADGVPKISDFGLAREMANDEHLTLPGARMGTPSYMAPEQASKRFGDVGRAADVYALGAILYEMMTGRPPFRGESPADTERQLLHEEVVSPSRLNARVPRDLETICLKCLQKDPDRRYGSAAALAEDLSRFQKGEPIEARRVGSLERTFKWVRRRPAAATAIASASVLAMVLAAGGTWIVSQRLADRRAIETDLADVADLQQNSKWKEADLALDRAALRLGEHTPTELRRRYDAATRDSKLVDRLDVIRSSGEIAKFHQADIDYGGAFRTAQLGAPGEPADVVAGRIRNSNVKTALIDALDDWSCFSGKHRPWLLEVARRADHDPTGWRDRVRDPAIWNNHQAFLKAMATTPFADQPVPFLINMASRLQEFGENPTAMAIKVQEAHPDDFWINLHLGDIMAHESNLPEAIRYFQAAVAIRPNAGLPRNDLAAVFTFADRWDEAIVQLRAAVRLEPHSGMAVENLARALSRTGRDAEAIPPLQGIIRSDPTDANIARLYGCLGHCLERVGREEEAVTALKKAMSLGHSSGDVERDLQDILIRRGHWDQVESVWQDAIKIDPASHDSWDGYAEYCIFVGHVDQYKNVCRQLLDRFENDAEPSICERTGRACLLLGDGNEQIARAAAVVDRALQGNGSNASGFRRYYMVAKALADYRLGNFDAALSDAGGEAAGVLKPAPQLIAAMAHYRQGGQDVARRMLAESVLSFDWRLQSATSHESWIYHVLRREAERLIVPNLTELMDGSAQPRDNDERVALLGACALDDLWGRRAQLWMHFTPKVPWGSLEEAARVAALAGSGLGQDAAKFTEEDRTRWRNFAIVLLSRRMDGVEKLLKSATPPKDRIRSDLLELQRTPDLAGVRDTVALVSLPKSEQDQCTAVWSRVQSVLDRCNSDK